MIREETLERYGELRLGLEYCQAEFQQAADSQVRLTHQLVRFDPAFDDAQWHQFRKSNTGVSLQTGEWEQWFRWPNGRGCSRFRSFGTGESLDRFRSLAISAAKLLQDLRGLVAEDEELAAAATIDLPASVGEIGWDISSAYIDWLVAVHETACDCPTLRLQAQLGNWMRSDEQIIQADETDQIRREAEAIEDLTARVVVTGGGISIPAHPRCETLQHDLFRSSAEAIALWLDPESPDIVPVGLWYDDPPVFLPHPELLMPLEEPLDALCPRWDAEEAKFWIGPHLIKHFRQPAENQKAVLSKFQEENWPKRIDNVFKGIGGADFVERFREAVRALNHDHRTPGLIRFSLARQGTAVEWETVQS